MRSNISVLQRPQLCLVTDPAVARLEAIVEQALAAGITMLQVRGHQLDAAYLYALTCRLCPLCHQYGALCIVNDRLDVGMAVKADGFQLGRRSLPLSVAREVVGKDYLLG
ncbi:MAG: thiamine phosphate synthase, partial [Ktedonobacteraceae bacterium]|nr:thiamine phosphate synthase [Ktedonobacteraceae bacterium]